MRLARMGIQAAAGLTLGLAGLSGVIGMAVGCAGYESYPDIGDQMAVTNPNTNFMPQVMAAGVRWVVTKYPAGGQSPEAIAMGEARPAPFAINLPPRTTWETCARVAAEVGMGARPLTAENTSLPIFHVTYVRVRGDEAQVHITRPVASLGAAPNGEAVPQEIKLQLRGGLRPWRVVGWREWQVGSGEAPELHVVLPPPATPEPFPSRERDEAFVPNPPANPPIGEKTATAKAPESPE